MKQIILSYVLIFTLLTGSNILFAQDITYVSNWRTNSTHNDPIPVCTPVSNIQHVSSSATTLKFRWQYFLATPTEKYTYEVYQKGNNTIVKSGILTPSLNCTATNGACLIDALVIGLTANTEYEFKLKRVCSINPLSESTETIKEAKTLSNDCVTPASIVCVADYTTVNITISPGTNGTGDYTLELYDNNQLLKSKVVSVGTAQLATLFKDLQPCSAYQIKVKPNCNNSTSWNFATSTLCCGDISNAKITDEQPSQFKVKWENPISFPTDKFILKIKNPVTLQVLKEIEVLYSGGVALSNNSNILSFEKIINSTNFNAIQQRQEYIVDIVPFCGCTTCPSKSVSLSAVTNYPCLSPSSDEISIVNVTDNSIAFSFSPPISSLTNQLKKKFFVALVDKSTNQEVKSIWFGPSNLNGTIFHQFDNLKENTEYRLEIKSFCCLSYLPGTSDCNWESNNSEPKNIKTLFELCKSPKNLFVKSKTSNTLTVEWTNALTDNDKFTVELYKDATLVAIQNDIAATNPILSHTFTNLTPYTDYVVKVKSSCCQAAYNGCAGYTAGGSTTINVKTDSKKPQSCTDTPTIFTFITIGNQLKIAWQPTNIALSSSGRRFIFYGLNGTVVIDDPTKDIIPGFTLGQTYNIKIIEVFDGNQTNFMQACDIVNKSISFENPCNFDITPIVKCKGENVFLLENNKPLPLGVTMKIKYRDVTQKLIDYEKVEPNNYCSSKSSSNLLFSSSNKQNITGIWAYVAPTINDKNQVLLSNLNVCSFYEIEVIYETVSNGTVATCKTVVFNNYFHTLSVLPISDINTNGIEDDCEGYVAPITPPATTKLAALICGQNPPINTEVGVKYKDAKVGDIFIASDFPFAITAIKKIAGSENSYEGEGTISVPLIDKGLLVKFDNIAVEIMPGGIKKVTNGTIFSKKDDANGIDLVKTIAAINAKNNDPNAKFCNEPVGKPDENGFDAGGKYVTNPPYTGYNLGDPFDTKYNPQGFDKDGNFLGKDGEIYNDCGCDIKGQSAPGKTCVPDCKPPYSWVGDNASTPEGLALYKLKEPELKKDFLKIIDGRMTNNAPLLTTQKGKCDAIRTAMSKDVVDLKYEKALVFGPQDAWVSVGMSEYFDKVPLPFKTGSTERIQLHKNLEQKHINLFNCDIDELKYSKIEKVLKELKDDKMLDAYLKSITFQIKSMEKDKANGFIKQHNEGKMNDFILWLAELLDKKIDYDLKYKKYTTDASNFENYPSSLLKNDWDKIPVGIGQVEPEAKKGKYQISLENIGQMAANDEAVMQLLKVYHEHPEKLTQTVEANLQFEYEQGYEKIGGISRAFVLEAVNKKRVISELLGGSAVDVQGTPLTKKKDGSAKIINTYYDNFKFTPQGATMDIFVIVNFRDYQQVFQVLNAPLSLSGFKEPIKLALGSDISFPLGKMARMTLKSQPAQVANNGKPTTAITNSNAPQAANSGDDGTYVVIDCDGFGGLNIDVKIEFCRNYLIPLDAKDIELAEPARVESSFKVKIKDFDDFVIEKLSFSPFTLEKHRDIKIRIKDIVLDFSDTYTPSIVKFPGNYITAFSNSANNSQAPPAPTKEWKGFYVGNIDVTLPKEWSSGSQPIVAFAKDFIIDDAGVSGILGAKNVLPAGNMSAWKFSITDLNITILHNKLVGAGFSGGIHLPILKDGQDLIYSAAILPGNGYQFAVKPPKDGLDVDVWVAKVKFYNNSFIDVRYVNKKFAATASLSGDIDVNGGNVITMEGFTFKELVLSTDQAVVSPGTWTIPTLGCHVRGFDLTISNIKLTKEEKSGRTYTKLNVDVGLSLGKDDGKGLSLAANGNFDVLGEVRIVNKEQQWIYQRVKINGFGINCSSNKFHLEGSLTFYEDDPTYGEGFYGGLKLNIKEGTIIVGAAAVFGKKMKSSDPNDYYRYFFVDAFVKLPKGVPLGPVDLNGFGGGVSWRMQKADFNNLKLENAPKEVGNEPTKPSMKGPVSLTGAVYVPDETIGLGVKLMTTMELNSNPNAFNAAAALELVFDADGTLNHIGFDGVAHFMAPPSAFPVFVLNTTSIPNGIHAGLKMVYDFNNNIFTAKMDAYANIEDGIIGCGGSGTNPCAEKKLGAIDMYFNAPQKQWYIKIGRTDDKGENRIGAGVRIKGFGQIIARAYFNIGNYTIQPMPPLPSYAAELVGKIGTNDVLRSNGKGFAFGAALNLKTGIDAFIYATLDVDLGFDMMLMQYPNVVCTNYNNNPIGINGWYAEGQLYARLMGKMGIKIKNKKISIGELTVAAAMAAGGPNPFWATGGASIQYNVLGGFIKGSAKATFKIGEKCEKYNPNGGSTEPEPNIQVIDKITPETDISNVSVFTKPKVDLLLPVDKVIEYEPGSYLKSNVSKVKFTYDNGIDMNVTFIYNGDKSSFTVKPIKGMFPSGKKCKLEVVATAYDCSSSGTILSTIFDDVRKIEFTTEKLTNIPAENIAASYPYSGMHNYHKEENNTGEGFVTLYTDQQDLFNENDDKTPLVRFYYKNKLVASVPFTYSKNKINFKMPNSKLLADKVYFMSFVLAGDGGGESNNGLASSQTIDQTIFSQFFRVSKYNTFLEKTKNVALNSTSDNVKLTAIDEPFDEQELSKDARLLDISFSEPSNWTNTMKTLYQQYTGKSFTLSGGASKTYYLDLVFNSNTGFFEKTSNTNAAKKVDKTSYDIGEISYSNQTFNYQFDFKVYQQDVNSAISGQVSSANSNYSSGACNDYITKNCPQSYGCGGDCSKWANNQANEFIAKLGNIQQPPKPTTTTFNFSYRIPTEAVNSSQVSKVCNH